MATVMIAWELGGGLGHTAVLAPVVAALRREGHRVVAVLRDVSRTRHVWDDENVVLVQAPIRVRSPDDRYEPPSTFAHILHNIGFDDEDALLAFCKAWHSLFDAFKPDVLIIDHSPTALLASRSYRMKTVVVGTGFCCPADCYPLPDWRPWLQTAPEVLRRHEDIVCDRINQILRRWRQTPINRISQLYADATDQFLTTLPELDHFAQRTGGRYLGAWAGDSGDLPEWPRGDGPRVFAYVKTFSALPALLAGLNRAGRPTLVYADGVGSALKQHFTSPTLKFAPRPLNMQRVCQEADMAILNGTHGTTTTMLLAGVPMLQVPIHLEQYLAAARTCELGCGVIGHHRRPTGLVRALGDSMARPELSASAKTFAEKYADFDPDKSVGELCSRVLELCAP